MRDAYEVLKKEGITLPQPPAKGGVYTPVQGLGGKFLYCSGCGPDLGNDSTVMGKLGKNLTVEDGQKATYNYVLNLLTNLDEKTRDLNRIRRFVKVLAFVNSADDFGMQPQVVNGDSDLIAGLFSEKVGLPAHSAIGTNVLPGGIAYEIEVLVELKWKREHINRNQESGRDGHKYGFVPVRPLSVFKLSLVLSISLIPYVL